MSRPEREASHDELILNYLENQATPTEEKHFRLLLGEESFRRRVAEYAIDFGYLFAYARHGMLDLEIVPRSRSVASHRRRVRILTLVAASLLLVSTALWVFLHPWGQISHQDAPVANSGAVPQGGDPHGESLPSSISSPDIESGIGKVAYVVGRVVATTKDEPAKLRMLERDDVLAPGDEIETVDTESFVLVEFHDGTLLSVPGESKLACLRKAGQKRVMLSAGNLMAQVAPQPRSAPMVIETPVAEAEVLGTKLSLFTDSNLSELAVHEGRVLFRRRTDGRTVDISDGQCAVVEAGSDLVARPIEATPTVWEEDFETGLPEGWEVGMWIRGDLLAESNGAVRAVPRSEDADGELAGPCFAMSQSAWSHGLFRIDEDSHLNFRYKVTRPGWFYVLVNARTDDELARFSGSFLFKNRGMCRVPRNQWQTKSIPLSRFRRPNSRLPEEGDSLSPNSGEIVFSLFFRTQETDPGLFIDRVWVTHGPPENVEVLDWSE